MGSCPDKSFYSEGDAPIVQVFAIASLQRVKYSINEREDPCVLPYGRP